MAVSGYDNIYDFNSPSEMSKPGDVELQPVEDSVFQLPTFNNPPQYINLPSEKEKYQNWRDPELETQFPSLNLDHDTPNQPPRTAFLDDQNPEHKDDPDRINEDDRFPRTTGPDHIPYQPQTLPDPYIDKLSGPHTDILARSIVAEYNLQHSPLQLDLGGQPDLNCELCNGRAHRCVYEHCQSCQDHDAGKHGNVKIAWTLKELVKSTSALSRRYAPNCEARFKKVRGNINRYDFHVKCAESWSDPSGHVVKIKFVPVDSRNTKAANAPILAACSCDFWKYYGADYNSIKGDYNERQMGNGAAPTVRGKNHMICKHLASCVPLIKYVMLKR